MLLALPPPILKKQVRALGACLFSHFFSYWRHASPPTSPSAIGFPLPPDSRPKAKVLTLISFHTPVPLNIEPLDGSSLVPLSPFSPTSFPVIHFGTPLGFELSVPIPVVPRPFWKLLGHFLSSFFSSAPSPPCSGAEVIGLILRPFALLRGQSPALFRGLGAHASVVFSSLRRGVQDGARSRPWLPPLITTS